MKLIFWIQSLRGVAVAAAVESYGADSLPWQSESGPQVNTKNIYYSLWPILSFGKHVKSLVLRLDGR